MMPHCGIATKNYLMKYFILGLTVWFCCNSCNAAALTIAAQGKSNYAIVLPAKAPRTVQNAARELQKDIATSTGATLPLIKDASAIAQPIIGLGQTKQATAAGININGVAEEGFRIITKAGNVYILGPDTANGKITANGGTSNGTANGVYTFLEDYLGVRWLMPGALGLDIPTKSTFTVDSINRTESPVFINRREPYIQSDLPAVQQWQDQQKLGYSFRIEHKHNWIQTVTPDLYQDHPDWFAMIDGKRVPPSGYYKLETTNPELVKFFAEKAIEGLKANPEFNTFSLSPSDSRGWSESPASKALYDLPHNGFPSVTPLILQFYRDVSDIVAREYPKGKLAGYFYVDYLYPPTKGGMTLPDNFYPVIAASDDYGFRLYRADVQHEFTDLLQAWSKVTPHLFYYDLPNTLTQNSGTITPPATEILDFIFPRLAKNNVKGVYIYGVASWSQAALSNYILAKMMWNPHLDANALQHEWLTRAYGAQAGASMEQLYQQLDGWFRAYYQQHEEANHVTTSIMLKELYGAHYAELEQLFLKAKSQPMTEPQEKRLQLIEDNLIVLQWRLKNAKALPANYHSPLTRSNDEVIALLTQKGKDFEPFPTLFDTGPAFQPVQVKRSPPLAAPPQEISIRLRYKNALLLYSANGGQVTISPKNVSLGKPFVSYALKDNQNRLQEVGIFVEGKPITFTAKAKTPYFFYMSNGAYSVTVKGAAVAVQTKMHGGQMHLISSPVTLYLPVPAGIGQWDLTLSTASPGETAKVTISSPDGKQAAVLETVTQSSQTATLKATKGFWKIEVSKAATGLLDDVFLRFDKELPHWVSLDPSQPLKVK